MDQSTNRGWRDCLNPDWYRRRFARRQDSEHEQALIRVVIILIVLAYVVSPLYEPRTASGLPSGLLGVFMFLTYAVLNVVLIRAASSHWSPTWAVRLTCWPSPASTACP